MANLPRHLRSLNDAQHSAVTHDPETPLQILAGPGSGKTRTLTCRIAHLIEEHKIPPSKIVAVTFTNKAANELRIRLESLIGKEAADSLMLGTFHAICGRLLRQHGSKIKVPSNFTILDADEAKKLVNTILKDTVAQSGAHASGGQKLNLKDSLAMEYISRIKAKGLSPEEFEAKIEVMAANKSEAPKGEIDPHLGKILAPVYSKYVEECRKHNSLDFDDLLMFGAKLLEERNDTINCEHIFVDEFQDTSAVQFKLMTLFAKRRRNISIVGDPDQSIYGWRSAEIENLHRMRVLFPNTIQIFLEDNYRSTGNILAASVAIISEDTERPPKTLRTSHPAGSTVTLGHCADEHEEALCIAEEVKRLKMISGSLLKWNDFAILLRFNALSRNLETALQKEGIPSRVLAGQKFFDRVEVKDLVAYLQIIDNPNFDPAAIRVLNIPRRAIGDKSIAELRARSIKAKKPIVMLVEQIVDGRAPDISPPLKGKARPFIQIIRNLRTLALSGMPVAKLIEELTKDLGYADHLQKNYPDWESRWENVRELITFATEPPENDAITSGEETGGAQEAAVSMPENTNIPPSLTNTGSREEPIELEDSDVDDDEVKPDDKEIKPDDADVTTPLRIFLQTTSLSTDTIVQSEDSKQDKVTIATCHSAKGLEWPVVFVPSVEDGTFPFYRTEDNEEERRLLYVACTRAQVFLYLTFADKRRLGGDTKNKEVSQFIKVVIDKDKQQKLFTHQKPALNASSFRVISKLLERECPDAASIEKGQQDYLASKKASAQPPASKDSNSTSSEQPAPSPQTQTESRKVFKPAATGNAASQGGALRPAVFSSARLMVKNLAIQNVPPTAQVTRTVEATATNGKPVNTIDRYAFKPASSQTGLREVPQNVASISSRPQGSGIFRPNAPTISIPTFRPVAPAFPLPQTLANPTSPDSGTPVAVPVEIVLGSEAAVQLGLPSSSSGTSASTGGSLGLPRLAGTKRRLGMSSSSSDGYRPRKK